MIVRAQGGNFILFKQYDHSKLSRRLASFLHVRPEPYDSVLLAIEKHDIGWESLDYEIKWNEETNSPHSFITYPLKDKLVAYENGINLVASEDAYAGYLCSRHLAQFLQDAPEQIAKDFYQSERKRQQALGERFTKAESDQLEANGRLLSLCDNLSLFLCLNKPGENTFPWFKNGFKINETKIMPNWLDESRIRFSSPLFSESFDISIPYLVINQERRVIKEDRLRLKIEA